MLTPQVFVDSQVVEVHHSGRSMASLKPPGLFNAPCTSSKQ